MGVHSPFFWLVVCQNDKKKQKKIYTFSFHENDKNELAVTYEQIPDNVTQIPGITNFLVVKQVLIFELQLKIWIILPKKHCLEESNVDLTYEQKVALVKNIETKKSRIM